MSRVLIMVLRMHYFAYMQTHWVHVEPNVIIDFKDLAAAQENDTELVRLKLSPSSLVLRNIPLPMSVLISFALTCNLALGVQCLTRFIHFSSWYPGNATSGTSTIHVPKHKLRRGRRYSDTLHSILHAPLLHLMLDSTIPICILWEHYHLQMVSHTC